MEKGGDKEIEKEEGSKQDTGRDRVENDILFYFHHPQNPFWTHACGQLKTSFKCRRGQC